MKTDSRTSSAYHDRYALAITLAWLLVSVMVVWAAAAWFSITESATVIAILILAVIVYGVISGRLKEFSAPGGWKASFNEVAQGPVVADAAFTDVTISSMDAIPKGDLQAFARAVATRKEPKPIIVTMTLGVSPDLPASYDSTSVNVALQKLSGAPDFRFVVILDQQGRLVS
jgi:hypothetical protein